MQVSGLWGRSCLLLLYLVAATPLAPLLTTILATTDCGHHVAIHQSERGIQVVLQHDGVSTSAHSHGLMARTLTMFARPANASQPDHVIQFSGTESLAQTTALEFEASGSMADPDANASCDARIHSLRLIAGHAVFPRPPPAPSGLLLTLRSTVLLI